MKPAGFPPRMGRTLCTALLAAALAACNGTLDDRNIDHDGSDAQEDGQEGSGPGATLTLTLQVDGLPDGAQVPLTVNQAAPVILSNGAVPLTVNTRDTLALGRISQPASTAVDWPLECGFDIAGGNGSMSNGVLTVTGTRNAIQPVHCGEVHLVRRTYARNQENSIQHDEGWLRVNIAANQAAWLTDAQGQPVMSVLKGSSVSTQDAAALTGRLVFAGSTAAHGQEPWVTDGTPEGTHLLVDLADGATGSQAQNFVSIGDGKVYFWAVVDEVYRLYETDGTQAGTRPVAVPDVQGNYGMNMVTSGGKLYFTDSQRNLFVKDAAGVRTITQLTRDTGGVPSGNPAFYAVGQDSIVFARSGTNRLWVSDGTPEGTRIIDDVDIKHMGSPGVVRNGVFYFTGRSDIHGDEPWRSDGTTAGTYMLRDIIPGAASSLTGSNVTLFSPAGDGVYFVANDLTNGRQLWKTAFQPDGRETANMVKRVIYVDPGLDTVNQGFGRPYDLTVAGNQVLFLASATNAIWPDIWTSDGTEDGTNMLFTIRDSRWAETRNRRWFTSVGGKKALFTNYSLISGTYLDRYWISDGTVTGSVYLTDGNGKQFEHKY